MHRIPATDTGNSAELHTHGLHGLLRLHTLQGSTPPQAHVGEGGGGFRNVGGTLLGSLLKRGSGFLNQGVPYSRKPPYSSSTQKTRTPHHRELKAPAEHRVGAQCCRCLEQLLTGLRRDLDLGPLERPLNISKSIFSRVELFCWMYREASGSLPKALESQDFAINCPHLTTKPSWIIAVIARIQAEWLDAGLPPWRLGVCGTVGVHLFRSELIQHEAQNHTRPLLPQPFMYWLASRSAICLQAAVGFLSRIPSLAL